MLHGNFVVKASENLFLINNKINPKYVCILWPNGVTANMAWDIVSSKINF